MKTALLVALVCACVAGVLGVINPQVMPFPDAEVKKDDGGWAVRTDTTRNGGTVVRVDSNKKWDVTDDGRVQAEVHSHWERTYGGPNDGQRDRGVGGSIGGSWGK